MFNSIKLTAADINNLRQETGAGMLDCKKALVQSEGDYNETRNILNKVYQNEHNLKTDSVEINFSCPFCKSPISSKQNCCDWCGNQI
jgi:hypothetical protein